MRQNPFAALISPLAVALCAAVALAACGTTERTVVVTPERGQTVIVTPAH